MSAVEVRPAQSSLVKRPIESALLPKQEIFGQRLIVGQNNPAAKEGDVFRSVKLVEITTDSIDTGEKPSAIVKSERAINNYTSPDLQARILRTGMKIVPSLEKLHVLRGDPQAFLRDIYFETLSKKSSPREFLKAPIGKVKEVIRKFGEEFRIRPRRASRCNGIHNVVEDPCGSPRCRSTKGKETVLNSSGSGQKGYKDQVKRALSSLKKAAAKILKTK